MVIPPPSYQGGTGVFQSGRLDEPEVDPRGSVAKEPEAFVYLLQSWKTGQCYLGWTTDLQRRLN
jgi:hypothetical protein